MYIMGSYIHLRPLFGVLGNYIHLHSSTISQHRCEGNILRLHYTYTGKDPWFVWNSIIVRAFLVTLVSTSMMIRIRIDHRIPFL